MTQARTAVIAGVGPGIGAAVSRRFAQEGYRVAMIARSLEKLAEYASADPAHLFGFPCDLTNTQQVADTIAKVESQLGAIDCAVFNAGTFSPGSILDIDPAEFERCWRVGALAGFLFGQQVARRMIERAAGAILFTGATASLRGSANFANLASPKFALRALAQSMARELGPKGIHVAHVIVDGQVHSDRSKHLLNERGPESLIEPEAVAEAYWQLCHQPRSAWTFEIDLRPWVERF